jgi:WD40 repeat protein
MTDRTGEQLGNYRLMRLLGRGGFAEVYLGEHIYLETTAAIKVLNARLASDDAEQFRAEARTIARLVHHHIVRVLEFGVEQETPYLVVDYAPNGTLRKRYPRGSRLPLQTIVSYVNQMADALHYAHMHRVIHRDVKPENMLIGRRQEILLSDFGIALVTQSTQEGVPGLQNMAGTVAYMAPEQIQSQAVAASDQYALAIVVYEWLSGSRPFQGSFPEVAVKHTLVAPAPLRESMPELSPAVETVVLKALSKDPQQRFPSVLLFAQALEQASLAAFEGSPHVTDPLSLSNSGALTVESAPQENIVISPETTFPAPLVSSQAVPLTLDTPDLDFEQSERTVPFLEGQSQETLDLARGEVSPLFTNPKPEYAEVPPSIVRRQITEPISTPSTFSRRVLITSITGVTLLAIAGLSWQALTRKPLTQSPDGLPSTLPSDLLLVYRGHNAIVWSAAWMPRGNTIASASADFSVQVWNAGSGTMEYTYINHTDTVYSVAWSPDGKRIASASYDQTVQVWDALTGYFPKIYTGHSSWVWCVAWSPDGRYIASAGGDKTVQVWMADTLQRVATYTAHSNFVYSLVWSPDSRYLASAGADQTVQVWEALSATTIYRDTLYGSTIWSIAWSPDSKRLAVAGNAQSIQVWDAFDGANRSVYAGHNAFIYALAWSSDGSRIASGGEDRRVHLWKADDGVAMAMYHGHTDAIRSLTWSPDNTRLASSSFDKTVRTWRIQV